MLLKALLAAALLLSQTGNIFAAYPIPRPPPQKYDHVFRGKLIIKTYTALELSRKCPRAWACTLGSDNNGRCTIHVTAVGQSAPGFRKVDAAGFSELVRHERGHCNGWPAHHPRT